MGTFKRTAGGVLRRGDAGARPRERRSGGRGARSDAEEVEEEEAATVSLRSSSGLEKAGREREARVGAWPPEGAPGPDWSLSALGLGVGLGF